MAGPWQTLSYVVDWIVIIIIAGAGAALYTIKGRSHAFYLSDPTISYPYVGDTISITAVGILALVVPAAVTAVLSALLHVSQPLQSADKRQSSQFRRRLWEWHSAWLGLAVAVTGAFCLTSGLKNIIGKPRPNLLARCKPDVSRIQEFSVGGLGASMAGAPILVNIGICSQSDVALVYEGFAAMPSGHTSFSFAGLLFLTLWLLHRLAAIPVDRNVLHRQLPRHGSSLGAHGRDSDVEAVGPPLLLVTVALLPVVGATCIGATRWLDNQHSGWDILTGALLGSSFAWLGFRLYHPSLFYPSANAWAARSNSAAFWPARSLHRAEDGDELELGLIPGANAS